MRILLIADHPPIAGMHTTGFGRVAEHIIRALSPYCDLEILAINYRGEYHDTGLKLWPVTIYDPLGLRELENLLHEYRYDAVLAFNDIWVLNTYWRITCPSHTPFYGYFPVDCEGWSADMVRYCAEWAGVATYTQFGVDVVREAGYSGPIQIIPHGVDPSVFKQIPKPDARKLLFGDEMEGKFIVLNANRNQPRKQYGLTIDAFLHFAKDKPPISEDGGCALYLHAGDPDIGIPLRDTFNKARKAMGIPPEQAPLIMSVDPASHDQVPKNHPNSSIEQLNLIYAAADVTINTALGEGWGLVPFEALFSGTPSVLGNNSVHEELWGYGRAMLVEPVGTSWGTIQEITPTGIRLSYGGQYPIQLPELFADALETLYHSPDIREDMVKTAQEYFSIERFRWDKIQPMFREFVGLSIVGEDFGVKA